MFDKLVDLLITWVKLLRIFVVCPPYEMIVITRFGTVHRIKGPGGAHWIIPFDVDEVYGVPMFLQTMVIGPQSLQTKDGIEVVVRTLVSFTVEDSKKYLITIQGGEQAIQDTAYGIVAKYIRAHTWEDLKDPETERRLLKDMRARAKKYGVEVQDTQLTDLTKAKTFRIFGQDVLHSVHLGSS